MSVLVWAGGHQAGVTTRPRPDAGDDWVLVDVAYCGLCGTDLHICAGEHPRARPGIVIGHEISGRLHADTGELPAGTKVVVDPLLPCGTCRTCLSRRPHTCATLRLLGIDLPGGAAEQVAVPADRLVPVPDGADLRRLAFAEPLAVAVRAVRRSGLVVGEEVTIVGGGPIGVAVAACARLAGAGRVLVAEPAPGRRGSRPNSASRRSSRGHGRGRGRLRRRRPPGGRRRADRGGRARRTVVLVARLRGDPPPWICGRSPSRR